MPFKIISPRDEASTRAWSDVDKPAMRRRLIRGLEEGESGVRPAIREVYAVLLSDDLEEAPSSNWRLPHHEVRTNGDVVLNVNGLAAAAGRINQTEAPESKIRSAANHLARHYRAIGSDLPQNIIDIIGEDENSLARERYTLAGNGKFVNIATGKIEYPRPGSLMVAKFHTALQPIDLNHRRAMEIAESVFLAQRKDKWPDGMDENGDFLYATYRALSETIVNRLSLPVDFTKKGVLKKGVRFLKDQPFLKDHSSNIDSQIGKVIDTIWDEGDSNIPAGINALVRVNAKAPQSASVIPLIEAGDANSVSVSVWYEWEKSHPDMDDYDFYWGLGEEVDGELVRVIVTKVLDLVELSIVWDGADPYAERIAASRSDGAYASFMTGLNIEKKHFNFESGFISDPGNQDSKEDSDMLEKLKKAVATIFGKEIEEIDDQFITDLSVGAVSIDTAPAVVDLLRVKQEKVDEYVTLLEKRGAEVDELKGEIDSLKGEADLGKKYLEGVREEAVKFYKLAEGESANETLLSMIETANLDQAIALRDQFRKAADEKVPLKCESCGSEKVSRASSAADDGESVGDSDPTSGSTDDADLVV